ncbi:Lipase 1 [Frankliniella fusca]|uniref:Lipase 1 n=1 Tax=Frankliniella fusca TaxID=407009 RepID=A0AAE1H773_9NEOP|nr:Lipase 1 [Frankliniella fusca]
MEWASILLLIACAAEAASQAYDPLLADLLNQGLRRAVRQAGSGGRPRKLLLTTNLIRKYGYPAEGHYTKTDDGYILRLDRLPRPGAPVVFVGNPLSTGSSAYCFLGNDSFAMKLYDAGYDVWLGNARGNGVAVGHVRLKPSQRQFWDFGLHEHAELDIPAMIDYILHVTGQPSLSYAGISMGSTNLLMLAAVRPEYDKFINGAFLMGPVSDISQHNNSVLLSTLHSLENTTSRLMPGQIPGGALIRQFVGSICTRFMRRGRATNHCPLLKALGDLMGGAGNIEWNIDTEDYAPTAISLKEMNHYAQLSNPSWHGFRQYNYGKKRNREIYGQDVPPNYDMTKTRIPMYFYVGKGDYWTPYPAIEKLRSALRNFRKLYEQANELRGFGHLDFAMNPYLAPKIYDQIIQDMKELRMEQQSFEENKKRSVY